jgi:hypothetical protein
MSAIYFDSGQGKHSVLMRVKTADAIRFVAVPLGKV